MRESSKNSLYPTKVVTTAKYIAWDVSNPYECDRFAISAKYRDHVLGLFKSRYILRKAPALAGSHLGLGIIYTGRTVTNKSSFQGASLALSIVEFVQFDSYIYQRNITFSLQIAGKISQSLVETSDWIGTSLYLSQQRSIIQGCAKMTMHQQSHLDLKRGLHKLLQGFFCCPFGLSTNSVSDSKNCCSLGLLKSIFHCRQWPISSIVMQCANDIELGQSFQCFHKGMIDAGDKPNSYNLE